MRKGSLRAILRVDMEIEEVGGCRVRKDKLVQLCEECFQSCKQWQHTIHDSHVWSGLYSLFVTVFCMEYLSYYYPIVLM